VYDNEDPLNPARGIVAGYLITLALFAVVYFFLWS